MRLICCVVLVVLVGCDRSQPLVAAESTTAGVSAPAGAVDLPGTAVQTEMRNVDLRITPDVTLRVRHLQGRFVSTSKDGAPFLDDKRSYTVQVDRGEIAIGMASLNALLNEHVLGHGRSNVRNLEITVDEGRLEQKGTLRKGVSLPFKTKGAVSATPDGRIRVHTESVRGLGVPLNPLMKTFGFEMDDFLKVEAGHGVVVQDNDLILDPQLMLPAPQMRGRITNVRIEGDELVQVFGTDAPQRSSTSAGSPNHIYWRGGRLRFGKLTMDDTDLELIDQDPRDPFDFSVDEWNRQLVAGYSKNTPAQGLKTYVPDYGDLERPRQKTR